MKKFFCLFFMVCLGQFVFAQSDPPEESKKKKKVKSYLFVVGGFQITTINGDGDSWDPLPSFLGGFGMKIVDFGNPWCINTSLEYSQQGSKYSQSGYGDGKVLLGYLNLPITARYRAKSGFYGEAGLQPGLLLSAKDKYEDESIDIKDEVNSFDLGVPVGIGWHFKNGLDLSIRVTPGLLNINKEGEDNNTNFGSAMRASFYF